MSGVMRNAVLSMPSGSSRLSVRYAPSFWPLTATTIFPAQSMSMPYSQRSPGSNSSGSVSALFLQPVTLGIPSAACTFCMSVFQIS
jgi:hypothetical protein